MLDQNDDIGNYSIENAIGAGIDVKLPCKVTKLSLLIPCSDV